MPVKMKSVQRKPKPLRNGRPLPIDAEALAVELGAKPMKDYRKFIQDFKDVWPDDREIDEFVAWVKQSRRENH